jgi:dihydroneopterin aldolase
MYIYILAVITVLFCIGYWRLRARTEQLTIHIRRLRLDCKVGLESHEKLKPQNLIVNVEVMIKPHRGRESPQTIVCYAQMVQALRAFQQHDHIELLEDMAERMAKALKTHARIQRVKLRIEKTEIYDDVDGVGVEIVKTF